MAAAKTIALRAAARKPRRRDFEERHPTATRYIKSTFNNTIVSLTDPTGAVVVLGVLRPGWLQGLA